MGRGKSADASEFWERYEQLAVKDFATSITSKIKPSTLSTYKTEKRYPRANEAVAIAQALGTTVEYLVTGEEPLTLAAGDRNLLDRARFYRQTIGDLDELEAPVREPLVAAIHGAAEAARHAGAQGQQGTVG